MLGLLLFICLANGSGLPLLADPDTHWHIAVGNWMLATGAVPTVDPFSFSFAGQPWIAKEVAVTFADGGRVQARRLRPNFPLRDIGLKVVFEIVR